MRDNNNANVNFVESKSNTHPPLYCKICDVRMMFMLTGKVAQKYLCGMCGYTVDPNEANESEDEDEDEDEHYSKHDDGLRSIDDDNDDVGQDNRYESMIIQANNDKYKQSSKAEESRRPQMTSQRQQYQQQQSSDDWAYQSLKHDIEADGQRRVIEINDDFNGSRVNRIKRPTN